MVKKIEKAVVGDSEYGSESESESEPDYTEPTD
jgi:hypothetical protein